AQAKRPETVAADPAFRAAHPGEQRDERPDARTAWPEQPMDRRIGVEERYPEPPQRPGSGAFPHPERAGEAKDDHRGATSVVSTAARNSRVALTGTPNQASNPGRPWCSSMPSPSTQP